ncbi:MAG: hydrophobe/amphiphile efflux-1 family RND transporter, partial [Desulfobulbus propionicus]
MARFFIDRPIFAWVIAIAIMLTGVLSIADLPVALFPKIAPPEVVISASYSGASAETIENNVVQVIEQSMTGLDHLLYMRSQSSSAGLAQITLTFAAGTDADIAQVQVQNKLQRALPLLPEDVKRKGVRVNKASSAFLLVIGLISPDGSFKKHDLADFLVSTLRDPLSRIEGVGSVTVFGSQYAMRIWLYPHKLNSYRLTPADVVAAVRAQNSQVAVGSLGGTPAVAGQQTTATITARTLMSSPEEFSNILIKVNSDGSQVRLKDVARVEIGAEDYSVQSLFNGQPASGAGIMLATGANALETVAKVKAKLAELKQYFPPGIDIIYPYDTTKFIKISITEVVHTLIEAVILVFLVMFLFLQNFRATLIPTITVPVVLLGTFGVMAICGFSINTLTMFGLVLAIGLLVDDAIVVVENVERIMAAEGLSPLEATRKTMGQITGALIGVALVLSAVFVPMAFFGGSTGVIYRQFSITIVSAMILSVIVAIV